MWDFLNTNVSQEATNTSHLNLNLPDLVTTLSLPFSPNFSAPTTVPPSGNSLPSSMSLSHPHTTHPSPSISASPIALTVNPPITIPTTHPTLHNKAPNPPHHPIQNR